MVSFTILLNTSAKGIGHVKRHGAKGLDQVLGEEHVRMCTPNVSYVFCHCCLTMLSCLVPEGTLVNMPTTGGMGTPVQLEQDLGEHFTIR